MTLIPKYSFTMRWTIIMTITLIIDYYWRAVIRIINKLTLNFEKNFIDFQAINSCLRLILGSSVSFAQILIVVGTDLVQSI